jgi:hypothetical protein
MASFSERMRIIPSRMAVQRADMDAPLRNSLWNVVYTMLESPLNGRHESAHRECRELFETVWAGFLKQPVHEISSFRSERLIATLREPFLIVWPWWKVYDFLEFLPSAFRGARHYTPERGRELHDYLNRVLEREMSAYRFVDGELVAITDEVEIEAIEHAVNVSAPDRWVSHLRSALELLTDRREPDYERSIEESVLAVDTLCRNLGRDAGDALEALPRTIRNGNGNGAPGFAEAKYVLVACSGFVNYLLEKGGGR